MRVLVVSPPCRVTMARCRASVAPRDGGGCLCFYCLSRGSGGTGKGSDVFHFSGRCLRLLVSLASPSPPMPAAQGGEARVVSTPYGFAVGYSVAKVDLSQATGIERKRKMTEGDVSAVSNATGFASYRAGPTKLAPTQSFWRRRAYIPAYGPARPVALARSRILPCGAAYWGGGREAAGAAKARKNAHPHISGLAPVRPPACADQGPGFRRARSGHRCAQ